jgi:hypothetical protein
MSQWFCYACGKRKTEACSAPLCPGIPSWADNGILDLREQIEHDAKLLQLPHPNASVEAAWAQHRRVISSIRKRLRERLGEEEV